MFFGILAIMFIVLIVFFLVVKVISFNNTTYHESTGNSLFETMNNKGKKGEYEIYERLRSLENKGDRFLFNVYLPKGDGNTTECDVILIDTQGLIVFESKNYKGWIFGDENYKTWTQTLPCGAGEPAKKERFYNPIMQNRTHIRHLKSIVGNQYRIQSVIVFSDECELKKVTVHSPDVVVTKLQSLYEAVSHLNNSSPNVTLSNEEIESLYSRLYPYSQVSEYVKQQHIDALNFK